MTIQTPFDTIAAVSTPPGEGGIGIVRLSGDRALEIVKNIFEPHRKQAQRLFTSTFTMGLGYIKNDDTIVDEVLLTIMKAPHTYTREDIVEINCHGGALAVNEVLRLVLLRGARLAEPGEFTKRAFINGRIDLSQAEAVLDIVQAKTAKALETAVGQLKGRLSGKIKELNNRLKAMLVILEANIDFADEEDVAPVRSEAIKNDLVSIKKELTGLIDSYDTGKILKNGVLSVIAGKPNVGKSSILNAFLRFDRAIVTSIPGTTRDVIEEQLSIGGIPFTLADTAGITDSEDIIEQEGVKRSRSHMERAQLVILVFDGSEPLDDRDREIATKVMTLPHISVINKSDLPCRLNTAELESIPGIAPDYIFMSAKTGKGLKKLENRMTEKVISGSAAGDHSILVTNARHYTILKKADTELQYALDTVLSGGEPELIAFDVRSAMEGLGEVTGKIASDDIMNDIFQNFCIGK